MNRSAIVISLVPLLLILLIADLTAQVSWYAFDAGFGTPGSSSIAVRSVVGQMFAGEMMQSNTRIQSGFLFGPAFLSGSTDVQGGEVMPASFFLYQNYPNPFNPSTVISFSIPSASRVSLKVYDLLGREVATLVNEGRPPGTYIERLNASNLASGMYLYRLITPMHSSTRKLMLVR